MRSNEDVRAHEALRASSGHVSNRLEQILRVISFGRSYEATYTGKIKVDHDLKSNLGPQRGDQMRR
jgi:hypothetical protein